ncbi:hypothetical protein B0H13DRAFT_1916356 [Mycena leptocephala]|nr:hypothetical protein B0H13DRAFT_1916356 [Mycena leptocephala]
MSLMLRIPFVVLRCAVPMQWFSNAVSYLDHLPAPSKGSRQWPDSGSSSPPDESMSRRADVKPPQYTHGNVITFSRVPFMSDSRTEVQCPTTADSDGPIVLLIPLRAGCQHRVATPIDAHVDE